MAENNKPTATAKEIVEILGPNGQTIINKMKRKELLPMGRVDLTIIDELVEKAKRSNLNMVDKKKPKPPKKKDPYKKKNNEFQKMWY